MFQTVGESEDDPSPVPSGLIYITLSAFKTSLSDASFKTLLSSTSSEIETTSLSVILSLTCKLSLSSLANPIPVAKTNINKIHVITVIFFSLIIMPPSI